jgi:hypothetical protein
LAALVEARYGERFKRGEDGGTFAAALKAVIRWGGVLEHPAQTRAWRAFDLTPPQGHGWARELHGPGWVCEVSQAAYGHRAPKATWLYYVGDAPPAPLRWAQPPCSVTVSSAHRRAGGKVRNGVEVMGHKERLHTPPAFRDALLSLARNARTPAAIAEAERIATWERVLG